MHAAERAVQRIASERGIPLAANGFLTQFVRLPYPLLRTVRMTRIALYLLPCLLTTACLTEPKQCESHPSNPATETFATSLGVDLNTMEKTMIGDYRKDLVVGTGNLLDSLQTVQIHYSAYLVDGTQVDQQVSTPVAINLATNATIGLADGMLGMKEGGQRLIVAPSEFAQGACPRGTIPGNSTLVYQVELITIGS
jgi:FKBP-type peptidyl-prolyl cis-trans isomerase FkpA